MVIRQHGFTECYSVRLGAPTSEPEVGAEREQQMDGAGCGPVPKVSTAQATRETSASRSVSDMRSTSMVSRLTVLERSPILHPSGR